MSRLPCPAGHAHSMQLTLSTRRRISQIRSLVVWTPPTWRTSSSSASQSVAQSPWRWPRARTLALLDGRRASASNPGARDRVRYVGEPVATVAAETAHSAEDALGAIARAAIPSFRRPRTRCGTARREYAVARILILTARETAKLAIYSASVSIHERIPSTNRHAQPFGKLE